MARYHMRRHFDDMRSIELYLLSGKLDDARTLAYLLSTPTGDLGLAQLDAQTARVTAAASALGRARGIDDAFRKEVALAVECASCHLAAGRPANLAAVPPLPPDTGTAEARMARHVWAVDRLWEGLIAPNDDRWSRGLSVLADTPLPFTPLTDAPLLARALHQRARTQLETRTTASLADRGTAYGELLVTCAACHSSLHIAVH